MEPKLKLLTPPATEPVTLQEAKSAARILTSDFDDIIPGLIKAGREQAENFQNTVYMTQTWELVFDRFPEMPFEMPKKPLQSLESVIYVDSESASNDFDKSNLIISTRTNKIGLKSGKTFPNVKLQDFDSVIFQFKAGVTDVNKVPESVKLAIKLFICSNIDRPDNPEVPKGFYDLLWPDRVMPA